MKYFFIINPISGHPKNPEIYEAAIRKVFHAHEGNYTIRRTQAPGHGLELARQAASQNQTVVAVGGDGTMNEVASGLIGTKSIFGFIPKGSGCGFANEFGIPRNPKAACKLLLQGKPFAIDAGKITLKSSIRYFFNIAGIGLDAKVGEAFNSNKHGQRRGLIPYIWHTFQELRQYKAVPMEITAGSMKIEAQPMLIAIGNAKEYGMGAKITPQAKINDGLFHVTMAKTMKPLEILWCLPKLFTGNIASCPQVSTFTTKSLTIKLSQPCLYHLDGETFADSQELHFEVLPAALNVLVPPTYRP